MGSKESQQPDARRKNSPTTRSHAHAPAQPHTSGQHATKALVTAQGAGGTRAVSRIVTTVPVGTPTPTPSPGGGGCGNGRRGLAPLATHSASYGSSPPPAIRTTCGWVGGCTRYAQPSVGVSREGRSVCVLACLAGCVEGGCDALHDPELRRALERRQGPLHDCGGTAISGRGRSIGSSAVAKTNVCSRRVKDEEVVGPPVAQRAGDRRAAARR